MLPLLQAAYLQLFGRLFYYIINNDPCVYVFILTYAVVLFCCVAQSFTFSLFNFSLSFLSLSG